jgi:hypothetical protein
VVELMVKPTTEMVGFVFGGTCSIRSPEDVIRALESLFDGNRSYLLVR